jgi:hypothetical protein
MLLKVQALSKVKRKDNLLFNVGNPTSHFHGAASALYTSYIYIG